MTYREVFTKLLSDVSRLDSNEPTIVTYDLDSNCLTLRQLKSTIMIPYINSYFFVKKRFNIGILTQNGLKDLIYNLTKLLNSNDLDNFNLIPDIRILGTSFYKYYSNPELIGPQELITLKYVSITNKLLVRYYCKMYNNDTRLIWKSYCNFKKLKKSLNLNSVESKDNQDN